MPESAAEHRCTNARAHLLSQLFDSPPNSDSPRDSSDILSLTSAARLRRPHRTNLPALCRLVELTIFLQDRSHPTVLGRLLGFHEEV